MGSHRIRNVVIGALTLTSLVAFPPRDVILRAQVSPRQRSESGNRSISIPETVCRTSGEYVRIAIQGALGLVQP